MADDLSIVIKAILEADQQESIRNVKTTMESALKKSPIAVDIKVDANKVKESAAAIRQQFTDALKSKPIMIDLGPVDIKKVITQYDSLLKKIQEVQKRMGEGTTAGRGTQNFPVDKEIQGNKFRGLMADAKAAGQYAGALKADIDSLGASLASITDASGLENWVNQFKGVESSLHAVQKEAKATAKSIESIALKKASDIESNQLAKLNSYLSNPAISEATTSGITALRGELQAIGIEWEQVIARIRSGKLDDLGYQDANKQLDELSTKFKDVDRAAKIFDGSIKSQTGLENVAKQIETAKYKLEAMEKNWSKFKRNPELLREFEQLQQMAKDLDAINLGSFNKALSQFGAHAQAVGADTRNLFDEIKNNLGKFTNWFGVSSVIVSIVRGVKDLVDNVGKVDNAMVSLKKVTDGTDASYNRFLTNASKRAIDLSAELTDLVDASTTWGRLGYGLTDASKLGEVSTIFKNVGDDVGNVEAASASIISVMKAFDMSADEAMSIVDKYNKVGNEFAVSSGNIAEGMRNSASSLDLAGNSLDQSIAMLTAMTEITQNASESGNSLKVLSMRLRGRFHASTTSNHCAMCA